MEVQDIGEFGLIERLAKIAPSHDKNQGLRQRLLISIGDDAAAWRGDSSIELATIDSLIQNVHFTLDTITFYDWLTIISEYHWITSSIHSRSRIP